MIDIIGLMMLAEAKAKPRRRRNEGACGAPVARFWAWIGPSIGDTAAVFAVREIFRRVSSG